MSVKVVVTSSRRYFCAGRCWEVGETEAVLEDLPGLPLEQQLAQLDAAKGGQQQDALGLERGNDAFYRAPSVLTYRVVEEPPPAPPAAVEAHEDLADPDAPPDDPPVPPAAPPAAPASQTEPPPAQPGEPVTSA